VRVGLSDETVVLNINCPETFSHLRDEEVSSDKWERMPKISSEMNFVTAIEHMDMGYKISRVSWGIRFKYVYKRTLWSLGHIVPDADKIFSVEDIIATDWVTIKGG
jgi:hypothetical protein